MTDELPQPLGFPHCARCPYRVNGTPRICGDCAGKTLKPIPDDHCPVCSQVLKPNVPCVNSLCGWQQGRARWKRSITRIDAVAQYTDPFSSTLRRFKEVAGHEPWGGIFGRLLVGWMETHESIVSDIDLIIGNPTHAERQPLQHIETIMAAAYVADALGWWPLPHPEKPVLLKTKATVTSKDKGFTAKEEAAWEHVMAIQRSPAVDFKGKKILLIDDVCTTGLQLNYLAYRLLASGAAEVRGLVLARVPWRY